VAPCRHRLHADDREFKNATTRLSGGLAAAGARVVERVRARGSTRLERLLSLVLLGDLVSLCLAVLRGVDPVEIEAITELKAVLRREREA
jgi:glucose/mannose-6-phosphate isomerase